MVNVRITTREQTDVLLKFERAVKLLARRAASYRKAIHGHIDPGVGGHDPPENM